jgi:hypothetical protein
MRDNPTRLNESWSCSDLASGPILFLSVPKALYNDKYKCLAQTNKIPTPKWWCAISVR